MTTPTGQISFTDISSEFGLPGGKNLGAYRVSQTLGDRAWTLDDGVPSSGTIRFSDLQGKTCNVVVDYGTGDPLMVGGPGPVLTTSSRIIHVFNDVTNIEFDLASTNSNVSVTSVSRTDPGGSPFNVLDRKHYLITMPAGFVIDSSVSNVNISDIEQKTADVSGDDGSGTFVGQLVDMAVSSKVKVSDTQFRVWFFAQPNVSSPPGFLAGNSYTRGFTISWQTTQTNPGTLSTAKNSYDELGVVVGGFKTKSQLSQPGSTQKVTHLLRRQIGGGLNTGDWSQGTVLKFLVASGGGIIGAGGRGGNGAGSGGYGSGVTGFLEEQRGLDGSPALYARYPCTVQLESASSRLQAGGGGGGGGGGACCDPDNNPQDPVVGGGGGGGGAGLPAGPGGGRSGNAGGGQGGTEGGPGQLDVGGLGGVGGNTAGVESPRDCAQGGGGGGGSGPTFGSGGASGTSGCGGSSPGNNGNLASGGTGGNGIACRRNSGSKNGGPGGANGKSVLSLSGIVVTVSNTGGGTLYGEQGTGTF